MYQSKWVGLQQHYEILRHSVKRQLVKCLGLKSIAHISSPYLFRVDVTFEMKTVLSRIRLFNDAILNIRHHFILNGNGGEESEIEERHRESVCERQSVVEGGGSISCKMVHRGKCNR
jgi:hypothetical protein